MCIYAYVVESVSKKSTYLRNNKKTELSNNKTRKVGIFNILLSNP